ncbi:MAG: NfeD family protein [Campylobacterales bacterium]|nr:NfeD family protein [Campylobacterales bacterium]
MFAILWWHWIVFGLLLLIIELGIGTFFILGFAIAAIIVGIMTFFIVFSFNVQLMLWLLFCIIFIAIWYKKFSDTIISKSGQSDYSLDTLGTVTQEIPKHARGKVVFDTPVLGNTEWHATSSVYIPVNTRIKIVKVNGQLIEVEPLSIT